MPSFPNTIYWRDHPYPIVCSWWSVPLLEFFEWPLVSIMLPVLNCVYLAITFGYSLAVHSIVGQYFLSFTTYRTLLCRLLVSKAAKSNSTVSLTVVSKRGIHKLSLPSSSHLGHLMRRTDSLEKILMLGKIEGGRRRDDREWDGWMASLTQWTWVWVSSRSWWWTGKPGALQSTGSQSRTRLSWAELTWPSSTGSNFHFALGILKCSCDGLRCLYLYNPVQDFVWSFNNVFPSLDAKQQGPPPHPCNPSSTYSMKTQDLSLNPHQPLTSPFCSRISMFHVLKGLLVCKDLLIMEPSFLVVSRIKFIFSIQLLYKWLYVYFLKYLSFLFVETYVTGM